MSNYSRLGFTLNLQRIAIANGEVDVAVVQPVVDGKDFGRAHFESPCDALSLVVRGADAGDFDLYTCSCGIAGCAGLHWEVQLVSDAASVTWRVPASGYRERLGDWPFDTDCLELCFERKQYLQALEELWQSLLDKECKHGRLGVSPMGSEEFIEEVTPLAALRERCQTYHDNQQADEAALARIDKRLGGQHLVLWVAANEGWALSSRHLCWLADDALGLSGEPAAVREEGWQEFVAKLEAEPGQVLRTCDWDVLGRYAKRIDDRGNELPGEPWPERAWPSEFAAATVGWKTLP